MRDRPMRVVSWVVLNKSAVLVHHRSCDWSVLWFVDVQCGRIWFLLDSCSSSEGDGDEGEGKKDAETDDAEADDAAASIDVQVNYTNPAAFEFIRTCYKKLGNMTSMNSICSDRDQPPTSWVTSDHGRGWLDVEPAPSGTIFSFGGLKQCKQYKVVSYAFYDNIDTGIKLGETNVHTPGDCKANKMAVVIVNDYDDTILDEYIELISPHYEQHLFHYLSAVYDPELVTAHKLMMEEDGVDIVQPKALIEYLIGSDSRIWDDWQQESHLVEQRLTLDSFVEDNYPELYWDILDDLREPPQREKMR